ncbi:MAG: phosphatidate cytidylyltransferase [Gemmataceae bacterium]|nr:phosphatidate cytidylyltransferase [Gemmataceae bacterium]
MIRTRVVVGTALAAAGAGVLVGDRHLAPWYPVFAGLLVVAGAVSARELVGLFPAAYRPPVPLAVAAVLLPIAANWYPVIRVEITPGLPAVASPWEPVLFAFAGVVIGAFLVEMAGYREPGTAVPRLALTVLAAAYLGVLGSFLARVRWLDPDPDRSGLMLALAIFVPKAADVGALFAGMAFGRHRMTPVLSPKKTWEGLAGGLLLAALVAVGIDRVNPVFPGGVLEAALFGVAVGGAGVVGDLAESMVKRDGLAKDAAASIPGFGGLLDVVDSVLFAAPVAYLWFRLSNAG